jgi:hypothetical protein
MSDGQTYFNFLSKGLNCKSPSEVADIFGVTSEFIRSAVECGEIKCFRPKGRGVSEKNTRILIPDWAVSEYVARSANFTKGEVEASVKHMIDKACDDEMLLRVIEHAKRRLQQLNNKPKWR